MTLSFKRLRSPLGPLYLTVRASSCFLFIILAHRHEIGSSFEHLPFSTSYVAVMPPFGQAVSTPWDAVHLNSIDKDTDGNYLISSRHNHALYKIDKSTGDIIWSLGGETSDFALTNQTAFYWQHFARWRSGGSHISLFDNGASSLEANRASARGLYLAADQDARTVTWKQEWLPTEYNYSNSQGNAVFYNVGVNTRVSPSHASPFI